MGFLNQKERVLDIALTDKGRELLSKNLLDFTYFAFSDEGVDYSGSLTYVNTPSVYSAVERVQLTTTSSIGNFVSEITASLGSVPTSGNILIAAIGTEPDATYADIASITQAGTTWSVLVSGTAPSQGVASEVWWTPNIEDGVGTDIMIESSDVGSMGVHIVEYSGIVSVDLSASNIFDSTALSGTTGQTSLATSEYELFFGLMSTNNDGEQTSTSPGFTQVATTGSAGLRVGIYEKLTRTHQQAEAEVDVSLSAGHVGHAITFQVNTNALSKSVTFDDYIHRNLSLEVTQKKNGKNLPTNKDLSTFLYTIPSRKTVLPQMVSSRDADVTITLNRRFLIDQLILNTRLRNRIRKPLGFLMRATIPQKTFARRLRDYINSQRYERTRHRLSNGQTVVGLKVAPNLIAISGNRVLDTKTGATFRIDQVLPLDPDQSALGFKREVEVILGLDSTSVYFDLRDDDGRQFPSRGFLVEVFESGSDGSLTKLGRDNTENPINDEVIEEGFDSFLTLMTDFGTGRR